MATKKKIGYWLIAALLSAFVMVQIGLLAPDRAYASIPMEVLNTERQWACPNHHVGLHHLNYWSHRTYKTVYYWNGISHTGYTCGPSQYGYRPDTGCYTVYWVETHTYHVW